MTKTDENTKSEKKVFIEDSIDLFSQSKTYRKVIKHRENCRKWQKSFCLDCFGGGLTKFTKDFKKECSGVEK